MIPLGGTSNHFCTQALRDLHGWDPWNVTEDCELGVRLARAGLETHILESTTWEEAVSRIGPWLRQRSRWVKGYWQTHLVHTRAPLDTARRLGLWRAALMLLTVGGQVAVLLANPLCWLLAALWLWKPWPLYDPAHRFSTGLLEAVERSGAQIATEDRPLAVAAAATAGPVRIEPGQPWFRRADGSFFYPVSMNIRSPFETHTDRPGGLLYTAGAPDPLGGSRAMEGYLQRMQAAGVTMGRVWMSPWFGGIEWTEKWNGYHGLGRYNLQNAWRVDRVLDAAEARGVFIDLALQPHGPFTSAYDVQWDVNPYNRANGGPLSRPSLVLTDPEARRWMNNRLRYCAARWGASPALFGWTLWIEVDQVNPRPDAVRLWHREATDILQRLDCGQHPISTEFTLPEICVDTWSLPGLTYIQAPAYNFGEGMLGPFASAQKWLSPFGKPLFIEEYAGHCFGGDPRWVAHEIHDGLWLGWTMRFAGTPMAWWWNFIFGRGLDRFHARFADFIRGEDLRGRAWRYPRSQLPGAPSMTVHARAAEDRAYLWICGPTTELRYNGLEWKRDAGRRWRQKARLFNPLAEDPGQLYNVTRDVALKIRRRED